MANPADPVADTADRIQIEIVLPLLPANGDRGSDLARAQGGLIPSLNRFCDPGFVARFTIVAPRAHLAQLESLSAISHLEVSVLAEEDLLLSLPQDIPRRGWYIQQMIKIAYAGICRTAFYLTVDADCLVIDMLDERLIVDGRAPAHKELAQAHPGWWAASATLLQAAHSVLQAAPRRLA